MKKLVSTCALTLVASAFAASSIAADKDTASTTTTTKAAVVSTTTDNAAAKSKPVMSNVVQQLQKNGYILKGIEFDKDKNTFKIDAIDRHGEKQSMEVTGAKELAEQFKKMPQDTSVLVIIKKFERNGGYVKSITMDDGSYKAVVVDTKGNEQNYNVDMATGKVSQ